jgi:hypothetical protein
MSNKYPLHWWQWIIPTYGNWGGPGWSSCKYTDDKLDVDWNMCGVDEMDELFKIHDYQWQCDNYSKRKADKQLVRDLLKLRICGVWKNIYKIAAIIGFSIISCFWWRK